MRRTLVALAAATTLAAPLITLTAVQPASASSSYCFQSDLNGTIRYMGDTTSGQQVPTNATCIVKFVRINFTKSGDVGYYEYKVASGGPAGAIGLCVKWDPGVSGQPVVDLACSDSGDTTQSDEELTDNYPHFEAGSATNYLQILGVEVVAGAFNGDSWVLIL